MAIKTSLPSTKRLFVVFTLLAFSVVVAYVLISPQASEVATTQSTTKLSGTLTKSGQSFCLKTVAGIQYSVIGATSAVQTQLGQLVNNDVTIQGKTNTAF